jgi:AcrR family transcriptional regulator
MAEPSTDRRRTGTRDRLLEAALGIFAKQGYAGTTVSELERAVGLTPGSGALYRHFDSKEALLLAAVRAYHERMKGLCDAVREKGPAEDAPTELTRILDALAMFLSEERPMVEVAGASDLPKAVRVAIGETWDEGYQLVADAFGRYGFKGEEAEAAAVACLGSLAHYVLQEMAVGTPPLGVEGPEFVVWWLAHWTNVLERGPETAPATAPAGSNRSRRSRSG